MTSHSSCFTLEKKLELKLKLEFHAYNEIILTL